MLLQRCSRLLPTLILLLFSYWSLARIPALGEVQRSLLLALPYGLCALAIVLGWYFNRARFVAAALLLALAYALIQRSLQVPLSDPTALYLFSCLSVGFPLSLLALLLLPERGARNRFGVLTAASALAWLLAGWLLFVLSEGGDPLTRWLPPRPLADIVLSWPGLALFTVAIGVFAARLCWLGRDIDAAAVGLLLCLQLTLMYFDRELISTVLCSAAALVLIVELLRHSYHMAYRDELTGLLGRRALNEKLKGLGRHYTLAMLDVDHFKKFNDTHGHDVGDDVLKMVAAQIDRVSGGGTAYRYGGEEFCVVFPRRDRDECVPHLETLREAIANYRLTLRDRKNRPRNARRGQPQRGRQQTQKTVTVTISIGVAERGDQHAGPEAVIKTADKALYRAKKKGRNCVVA